MALVKVLLPWYSITAAVTLIKMFNACCWNILTNNGQVNPWCHHSCTTQWYSEDWFLPTTLLVSRLNFQVFFWYYMLPLTQPIQAVMDEFIYIFKSIHLTTDLESLKQLMTSRTEKIFFHYIGIRSISSCELHKMKEYNALTLNQHSSHWQGFVPNHKVNIHSNYFWLLVECSKLCPASLKPTLTPF